MIEQAMIFALGFLVAGLVALLIAPAFWWRAVRLARRRVDAQVPVSIEEILAERDQLRAQHVVQYRRLEEKAAALNKIHATHLHELGRRAAQIVDLEADLAGRQEAYRAQVAETARLTRELAEARAEAATAEKALYDAETHYDMVKEEARTLTQTLARMTALAEVRLASLVAAENYTEELQQQLASLRAELAALRDRFSEKTREADQLQQALTGVRGDFARTQRKLEAEKTRSADLEAAVSALRAERKADAEEMQALNARLETSLMQLQESRAREKELVARHSEQIEKMREKENLLTGDLQSSQSDNAVLKGALDVVRQRCSELETLVATHKCNGIGHNSGANEAEENLLLRESINEIGAAIAKLATKNGGAPLAPAGTSRPEAEIDKAAAVRI